MIRVLRASVIIFPIFTSGAFAEDHPYVNDMRDAAKSQTNKIGLFAGFFSLFSAVQSVDPRNAVGTTTNEIITGSADIPSAQDVARNSSNLNREIDKIFDDIGDPYAITSGGRNSKPYE